MRAVLALLALLAAPAFADESVPSGKGAPPEKLATLERTACFGTCPAYRVTVYSDGKLEYAGEAFVKFKGPRTAKLSAKQLAELAQAFKDADYFALADAYVKREWTDNPTCNTSFNQGGRRKAVAHYHGDHSAPAKLTALENRIDQIIQIERFIGSEAERDELEKQGKLH